MCEVSQKGSDIGSQPMPCRRPTPVLKRPAATRRSTTLVIEKNRGRLTRRPPRKIAQPGGQGDASQADEDIAPRACVRGLAHQTPEEQNGFRSLTEDASEGDQAHDPQAPGGERGLESALDITLDLSGVLAHPPPVPRQECRRAEH